MHLDQANFVARFLFSLMRAFASSGSGKNLGVTQLSVDGTPAIVHPEPPLL
jgi:hypothetical protein